MVPRKAAQGRQRVVETKLSALPSSKFSDHCINHTAIRFRSLARSDNNQDAPSHQLNCSTASPEH
jgi:hypothetical protein